MSGLRRLALLLALTGPGLPAAASAQGAAPPPLAGPAAAIRWVDVPEPGGVRLRMAVAWPEGIGRAPVVLVVHGTEGFSEDDVRLAEAYAAAGFVGVAACWFAGNDCPQGPPFVGVTPDTVRHVKAILTAALGLPRAREEVGVLGHSRGATLALLAASTGVDLRAVVVTSPQIAPGYRGNRRRTPIDVAPIDLAAGLHAPVLILQATHDPVTDVHDAREYERVLHGLGKPVDAHYYESDAHGLPFGADTRADVLQRSIAFFRRHLAL